MFVVKEPLLPEIYTYYTVHVQGVSQEYDTVEIGQNLAGAIKNGIQIVQEIRRLKILAKNPQSPQQVWNERS